tara:strand:+ start:2136 stop:3296 length:1161 start_codon:yes stop_codon:yes gene_type:complete
MNILITSALPKSLLDFRSKLIKELIIKDNRVFVIAPNIKKERKVKYELEKLGVKILDYPLTNRSINVLNDLISMLLIFYNILNLNIDLVLAYNIKPVIYSGLSIRLLNFLKRKKIKFFPLITGLGYIFTYTSKSFSKRLIFIFVRFLYKESLKNSNCVIFQNLDDKKDFMNLKILNKNQKTERVWGSGINLEEFRPKKLPKKKIFLMVSRLLIEKGVEEYMEAARIIKEKYPDVIFRLIGGFTSNKLASINRSNLDNVVKNGFVEYLGEIPLYEVREELSKCRYFVLPSYREGTPRSVLEALAIGRPVITSDCPGCRETVIDGINGKLIRPRDVLDLVEKIELLINFSDKVLIKMSKESINLAKEKYDVNKVNKKIIKIICEQKFV